MLAESGQTPNNCWYMGRRAMVQSAATSPWVGDRWTLSVTDTDTETIFSTSLHSHCVSFITGYLTSLYFSFEKWVETIFSKKNIYIWTRDFMLLTQKSIKHMRSGYFRFIKTAQSRTLNPVWSEGLDCLNIRWQESGFNGTRPRNNPIWHSHREGTGACKTDVKATDLAAQATLWAWPPHPSIAHCDWLIKIYYCPLLWAFICSARKDNSCHVRTEDIKQHDAII